ncbi:MULTISPECIES: DUF3592 domain-containing protein [Kitasatospora]
MSNGQNTTRRAYIGYGRGRVRPAFAGHPAAAAPAVFAAAAAEPACEWPEFILEGASRTGVRRRALRTLVNLVGAVAFMVTGLVFDCTQVHLWVNFADAEEVPAVVTDAEYVRTGTRESPAVIRVAIDTDDGPVEATADDPAGGPNGLTAGDRVRVLFDPARPGHAAFPGQLDWNAVTFPGGGFTMIGLALAGQEAFLAARRLRHRRIC